jgi:hypothetical protein
LTDGSRWWRGAEVNAKQKGDPAANITYSTTGEMRRAKFDCRPLCSRRHRSRRIMVDLEQQLIEPDVTVHPSTICRVAC